MTQILCLWKDRAYQEQQSSHTDKSSELEFWVVTQDPLYIRFLIFISALDLSNVNSFIKCEEQFSYPYNGFAFYLKDFFPSSDKILFYSIT